jgi:hypothetical protein
LILAAVVVCVLGSDLRLPLAAETVKNCYPCAFLGRVRVQDVVKLPDGLLPADESM